MDLRGPVLVGTDLTDAADEALRAGAELARALQSQLTVCHVAPELVPEGSLFDQFRRTNPHARESVLARARLAVQARLDAGLHHDVVSEAVVLAGEQPWRERGD